MFWPNETSLSEILLRGFSKLSLLPPPCFAFLALHGALFGNADFQSADLNRPKKIVGKVGCIRGKVRGGVCRRLKY